MGIVTDEWVQDTLTEQRLINGGLLGQNRPSLHLVTTNDARPNLSYQRQSRRWGELTEAHVVPHRFADDYEAADFIGNKLGPDPDVDGILAYLPSWTKDGETAIRKAMPADKDVDGVTLNQKPVLVPATAEAMRVVAERASGKDLRELGAIGIVGFGDRTLRPLVEDILQEELRVEPAVVFKTREEIEALRDEAVGVEDLMGCDTIFTAVPGGIIFTPDRVRDGQLIIDVGTGGVSATGKACGNVDPRVFSMSGLIRATAFRNSVGPITTAITQGRAINNRLAKLGMSRDQIIEGLLHERLAQAA
jgi:5,10-methylene-tetrahydrofolate dehydrogenase/methenyl tetrahydrofolate cyclohydrolase